VTLLSLVQEAAPLCSLQPPSTCFGTSQETPVLLRTLANREIRELSRRHEWPQLVKEHAFQSVAQELQTNALPADLGRIIPETFFNRDSDWRVFGPLTPQEWSYQVTQGLTSAITHLWMRQAAGLRIYPAPAANMTLAYMYQSDRAVIGADAVAKAAFTADTDTCALPEELVTLGVVWRYLSQKGMDYAEALKSYELAVVREVESWRAARKLSIIPGASMLGPRDIVPESDWNQ